MTAFDEAATPTLDASLLAMSNFGPVTACDLNVGESEDCSANWSPNLAQSVQNAISTARTTYHTAIWNKKNKEDTKTTAIETNTGKQSSFLTAVETTVDAQIAHCTGNDGIHASAVNAFNAVNARRAAMYHQLTVLQCHVNHLDEGGSSAVPEAATQGAISTSAADCVSKIKTQAQIRSARFPDEALSGHASTCPTQADYMNQIKAFGDMKLSDQWTPGATTCAAVATHGGSSSSFSNVAKVGTGLLWGKGVKGADPSLYRGNYGDSKVPVDLTNLVDINCGAATCTSRKSDGTGQVWGHLPHIKGDIYNLVKISCGEYQCAALKRDGTGQVWGDIHTPSSIDSTNLVDITCGFRTCVTRRSDGTGQAWGQYQAPNSVDLTNLVDTSCGGHACVALKEDGTGQAWGHPTRGETQVLLTSLVWSTSAVVATSVLL